jgi:hypothetical protein
MINSAALVLAETGNTGTTTIEEPQNFPRWRSSDHLATHPNRFRKAGEVDSDW